MLGALASGVPMVILPGGADTPVNARRAAALGTAVVLGADEGTLEAVGAKVWTVLDDPGYRQSARQVQAEIEALPGPERGIDLLENKDSDPRGRCDFEDFPCEPACGGGGGGPGDKGWLVTGRVALRALTALLTPSSRARGTRAVCG